MDTIQNTKSETISIIVVMNGFATTVGSNFIFFASKGKKHPISFAMQTVINKERETTIEILIV